MALVIAACINVFKGTRRFQKMRIRNMKLETILATVIFAGAILSAPSVACAMAASAGAQDTSASAIQSRLNKKQFRNIKVAVDDGVATLTGTVELYQYKADAQKTAVHTQGVKAVRNQIEVTGENVSDADLQKKLVGKLSYDRVDQGNVFDAISVSVKNGVVTLGGHAHNYVNRNSALGLVSSTPGVKDMVNNIQVDPVSQMDDQTRLAVANAIYGFTTLNRYALDPAKPIRISVQNGNVELYGVVDSKADKDVAYIRANGVAGVFSVKNYLQVAGQPTERPE
jgi:osmotically-inducible protein OsmY